MDILKLDDDTSRQLRIINLQTELLLLRDLIDKLDPDHDYRYDSQAGGFIRSEREILCNGEGNGS